MATHLITADMEQLAQGIEHLALEFEKSVIRPGKSAKEAAYDFGIKVGMQMGAMVLRVADDPIERMPERMDEIAVQYEQSRSGAILKADFDAAEYCRGVVFGLTRGAAETVRKALAALADPLGLARDLRQKGH